MQKRLIATDYIASIILSTTTILRYAIERLNEKWFAFGKMIVTTDELLKKM